MAKKSMIQRNLKRRRMYMKYKSLRSDLRSKLRDPSLSDDDRFSMLLKLSTLPRNGSITRTNNICSQTGRPRGYIGWFDMSRIAFSERARKGQLPGVVKASW